MGKHINDICHTSAMPKDVKIVWSMGVGVMVGSSLVLLIPALILLIAFPISLVFIAILGVLLVGGYIKGKKADL